MKLRFFYYDAGYVHPVLGRVFRWEKTVIEGNDAKRYERYVCGVLSAIAQRQVSCDRLLKDIDDVENGIETEIETGGNDVALTIRPAGVQVDILVNDDWCDQPEGHFELREWKIVLEGWRRFLGMPESAESVVEVTL